jgi:hypothetical protein
MENYWMGGALSMIPGFVVGLLAQRRLDPSKLSEHKSTVSLLGIIAAVVSGFAVYRLLGSHAG